MIVYILLLLSESLSIQNHKALSSTGRVRITGVEKVHQIVLI